MASRPVLSAPTLLHRADAVPADAVPLARFVDRYAVADLVTVLAGESRTACSTSCSPGCTAGYADDVAGAALALFEGVVDLLLAGTDLMTALVAFDGSLRPAGVWTRPSAQRPLRVQRDQAVRLVVDAFSPYVAGGEDALRVLADARAHVLAARPAGHAAAG